MSIQYADARDITFITLRDRDRAEFEELKNSIRDLGQRTILKVQDISGWKPEKRRRPDGGVYKWRAAFGQGRCTAAIELYNETGDKGYLQIPIKIVKNAESELAGMSMTENMLRRDYTWQEKARLMKRDVENFPLEVVARGYAVDVPHLKKVLKVLQRLSPKVEKELKRLTLEEASSLTSLPHERQEIVLQVMHDEGLREAQLPAIVRKARELPESSPELSKTALKASLRRVGEELKERRDLAKLYRLHHENGPEVVKELRENKKYTEVRAAMDAAGIDFSRFDELTQ